MRFLRVLGLVFINARRVWHIGRPEPPLDFIARLGHSLGRHINTVGPHIGDVARFIKALC